jgi:ribosome maturation factor RimP
MVHGLQGLVESVVAATGLDLEDVDLVGTDNHRTLRVVVDADDGVGIDAISELSRALSHDLDDSGLMGQRHYTLEVTSRGVSSPLTAPRHWRRNHGRLVKARLEAGGDVIGRIVESGDESVVLDAQGQRRTLAYADVARAIVQVELTMPKKNREDH